MTGKSIFAAAYIVAAAVFFGAAGAIVALAFDVSPIPLAGVAGYIGTWLAIFTLRIDQ